MKTLHLLFGSAVILFFGLAASTNLSSCKKKEIIVEVIKRDTVVLFDSSACYNLKDSLVAWYKFTSGSLVDSSGKGNHITFNNATPTTDRFGKPGNAYLFNGNGSYMRVNNSSSLNPSKITLVAFVKFNDFYRGPCHANQILKKGFRDQNDGIYGLRVGTNQPCNDVTDTTKEAMVAYYGNNQFNAAWVGDNQNFIKANRWINVVYTYDSGLGKLYIDGKLRNTVAGPFSFTPNSDGLFIGRAENPSFPFWFNGVIDEIRIYNKALCDGEIALLNKLKD
jgi:hypothetical protein